MESMNQLLEKYFAGETSMEEENELKLYFKSAAVLPEHEEYRFIFAAFEEEANEKAIQPTARIKPEQQKIKRIWIKTFAYTGIAATLLLLLWVKMPQQSTTYAMIGGTRVQDSEFAEKYTAQKLNEINDVLHRSMKPIQSIEKVRNGLQPIRKLNDVKKKLNDIENKLKINN